MSTQHIHATVTHATNCIYKKGRCKLDLYEMLKIIVPSGVRMLDICIKTGCPSDMEVSFTLNAYNYSTKKS
jgi:hypothetical protein